MRKHIVFILAVVIHGFCFAQINISLSTGLAGFKMYEMKDHQAEIRAQFPTDVKVIKSFPAYWSYDLSVTGNVTKRVAVGGAIGFTSTGGRMHYRDYSGAIECNQLTTAVVLGSQVNVLLNPDAKWAIYFSGKSGAMLGRYDLDVKFEVNNTQDSDNLKFRAFNLFIEPGLIVAKKITGILSANLSAGYNVNVYKGNLKYEDNTDYYLQDNAGDEILLDWSGFRLGVGLSVAL